jgi:hypothetical protein
MVKNEGKESERGLLLSIVNQKLNKQQIYRWKKNYKMSAHVQSDELTDGGKKNYKLN